MDIVLTPIESSALLLAAGYDESTKRLALQFRRGEAVYVYSGVPPESWAKFQASPSKGNYVQAYIRGRYPSQIQPKEQSSDRAAEDNPAGQ